MKNWKPEQQKPSKIKEVTKGEKGYTIYLESGWGFFLDSKYNYHPKEGQEVVLWTVQISINVGVAIDGEIIFMKTEAEFNDEREKDLKKLEEDRITEYEKNKEKYIKQLESLPDIFQRRIRLFMKNSVDFNSKFLAYELGACLTAVQIAEICKTEDKVIEFSKMDWKEKKELIPDLDEGHSGNSFGCAVRLAHCYILNPVLVYLWHGAMAPLTGCKEYGCIHPRPEIEGYEIPEKYNSTTS